MDSRCASFSRCWYAQCVADKILPMAKLGQKEIRTVARALIAQAQGGIRYGDLAKAIKADHPETPDNTIQGSIWNLPSLFPKEIIKPSRGLFMAASQEAADEQSVLNGSEVIQEPGTGKKIAEKDFYEPFAQWLKNDLDEVTEVAALGGGGLKGKWGTPDVIGVYKPRASDLVKFSLEVVSAEIKVDPQAPVVAFGQAVAYRLFSWKTYIAMPSTLSEEDQSRLETLCMLFGVGLVLFELNPELPNFLIRVRAQRFSPDMFYVNEFRWFSKQAIRDCATTAFDRVSD